MLSCHFPQGVFSELKLCHQQPLAPVGCQGSWKMTWQKSLCRCSYKTLQKTCGHYSSAVLDKIFPNIKRECLIQKSSSMLYVRVKADWTGSHVPERVYHLPTETVCKWLTFTLSASVASSYKFCTKIGLWFMKNKQSWWKDQLVLMILSLFLCVSRVQISSGPPFLKPFNNWLTFFISEAPVICMVSLPNSQLRNKFDETKQYYHLRC